MKGYIMYGGSGYRYRRAPVPCGDATRVGLFTITSGMQCRWALWGCGQCLMESDLRENLLAFADAMMVGIDRGCVTIGDGMFILDVVYHETAERATYCLIDAEALARWFEQS